MVRFAELHARSAFTFGEGAASPEQMVKTAVDLDLSAIAILDVDGMYSAVETARAAKNASIKTVYGSELTLQRFSRENKRWDYLNQESSSQWDPGLRIPILATGQEGYHELCKAISEHNLAQEGRRCGSWSIEELATRTTENWKVLTGDIHGPLRRALVRGNLAEGFKIVETFIDYFGKDRVVIEAAVGSLSTSKTLLQLKEIARQYGLPLVASAVPKVPTPKELPLAELLFAGKQNQTLEEAKGNLPGFESFMRSGAEMKQICHVIPEAVEASYNLAQECAFDLTMMKVELPQTLVPKNHTDWTYLQQITYEAAAKRYGSRSSNPKAWAVVDHELEVIRQLDFAGYFLIVKDIVDYCRRNGILCQGRGSAANSAVCYSLEITAVDAVKHALLFERFLSVKRATPPDIDIDIEARRREEVIQYVYRTYGRQNAAQVANVITYRPRSAVRLAGSALGYDEGTISGWTKNIGRTGAKTEQLPQLVSAAAQALQRLPNHLGIHPGGMVLTKKPVTQICPVMWAKRSGRTVLQWDKEDCADANLVKFDLLGLGMLTALNKCFVALKQQNIKGTDGMPLGLYNLPDEDPQVYDLLCQADTVGVFQVESRAQMSTLPRMRPRCFYDLVIEIALIRPGPIQGQSVNPYLRRRGGEEPVNIHPLLERSLSKTLGIPLFQEQLMQIAVDAAGFTPEEADELRRVFGAKHHRERLGTLMPKLLAGMESKGINASLQKEILSYFEGFSSFGFPESHAFSFAFLVYASAWLKVHHPHFFYAAILASQPMGFYSVATIIADAKRHGLEVYGPNVTTSQKETAVLQEGGKQIIQLGLEHIKGLSAQGQNLILRERQRKGFVDLDDFFNRVGLTNLDIKNLIKAGALDAFEDNRSRLLWHAEQFNTSQFQPPLPGMSAMTDKSFNAKHTPQQEIKLEYEALGVSLKYHPVALMRDEMSAQGCIPIAALEDIDVKVVQIVGNVTHRQRPSTAKGTVFLSLEDETGLANVICTPNIWDKYRSVILNNELLQVKGRIERRQGVYSLKGLHFRGIPTSLRYLSRNFR